MFLVIVRPRPSPFDLLFILRGSILPVIAPRLLFVMAVSASVTGLNQSGLVRFSSLTPASFTLLGLGLSIFLGFRNNACYERWWEARKQWGQLVAETRGLVRDGVALLPAEGGFRRRLGHRAIAFAQALRDQLRGDKKFSLLEWLPQEERDQVTRCRSQPDAILRAQTAELGTLLSQGLLSDISYCLFSDRLQVMGGIQAACERLRSTPTPFTYTLLLHRTAWLFCLLLPFGIVGTLGLATPVLTTILAYAFFGLDALGDELEQPFGLAQNAVPIDALARVIEIAALEALGEVPPPAPVPEAFVLY